jgi:hypothetical protein
MMPPGGCDRHARGTMAIIFELSALCHGATEREAFVRHVDGFEHELTTTGRTIRWNSQPDTMYSPFAVTGHAAGLSNRGVRTVVDALEATEAGLRLYDRLRSAPRFRYAIVGWDSGNIPPDELVEWLTDDDGSDGWLLNGPPYVVDAELYAEIGKPQPYKPFHDGYWWVPYRGEQYRPLGSNDHPELMTLQQRLFPELFRR